MRTPLAACRAFGTYTPPDWPHFGPYASQNPRQNPCDTSYLSIGLPVILIQYVSRFWKVSPNEHGASSLFTNTTYHRHVRFIIIDSTAAPDAPRAVSPSVTPRTPTPHTQPAPPHPTLVGTNSAQLPSDAFLRQLCCRAAIKVTAEAPAI